MYDLKCNEITLNKSVQADVLCVTQCAVENGKYGQVCLHHPHAKRSGGSGDHGILVSWMILAITLYGAIVH
jgi:hypothetical protein